MGIGKEKKFIIVVNVMLVFVKRIILKQDTLLNGIKQDIGKKLNVNCVVSKLETQFKWMFITLMAKETTHQCII